jgi:hypothetical protein
MTVVVGAHFVWNEGWNHGPSPDKHWHEGRASAPRCPRCCGYGLCCWINGEPQQCETCEGYGILNTWGIWRPYG